MTAQIIDDAVHARPQYAGVAAILGAAALWGTVGPTQVFASSAADPGALGVARLLVGGLALAVLCRRLDEWRQVLRRETLGWILLATAATGLYQVAFMHAVDKLGAALGTAIALGIAPVATGVFARWWTHERLSAAWVIGTLAAVSGCIVLLSPWEVTHVEAVGLGIAVISGVCYGAYTVAAKRFLQAGAPALPATTITLVLAGVALSPILAVHPAHLTGLNSLALIMWTGLAGTAVAYAAFAYGLRRVSAPTAGTLSLAEPLLAAVLGFAVLREPLTVSTMIGCLLLIVGLAAASAPGAVRCPRQRQRQRATKEPRSPARGSAELS